MKTIFLLLATMLTIGSVVPYLRDIVRGKTKPNIVSWITWTLLTGIATVAEVAGGEYVTAIFTASAVLATLLVVLFGLRYGFVKYTAFDIVCQVSAIIGIVLWQVFNSPTLGVIASVSIDFIGALPTFRHVWLNPSEETWSTFAISAVGAVFAVLAITTYNWVSLSYAVYIILINIIITGGIVARRHQITAER